MASLAEIQAIVERIREDLPALINRSKIAPKQIMIVNGLSDVSERMGLIQAGEFRSGNGVEPGFGFSGVRIGYPAFSYNGELWNIVGVNNDVLQVGIRASDGKFIAGGGDVFADEFGFFVKNQEGLIGFQDLTTGTYDNVTIYIDGSDELVLQNRVGGAATGIRFDIDTPAHDVVNYSFEHDAASFPGDLSVAGDLSVTGDQSFTGDVTLGGDLIFTSGGQGKIYVDDDQPLSDGWFYLYHTWTRTGNHTFTVPGDQQSTYRKGARLAYTDNGVAEYGTVQSSAYNGSSLTTVTLLPNDDYALSVSGPFASQQISYMEQPNGFPAFFDFTPSNPTGGGSMSVSITNTVMAKYRPMTAGLAEVIIQITVTTSGTASTQIFIDVPFAVLDTNAYPGLAAAQDGTASTEVALGVFNGNLGKIQWRHAAASVNWGIGAGIILQIHGFYPY